jgi:uncharacterized protein YndB with AHSA1/START domain
MKNTITVQTTVTAPITKVWDCWNKLEHINGWAFADPSWGAEAKENDLRVGGKFKTTMFAKDKSASFDFTGTYDNVVENELIEYTMDDGRHVKVEFEETPSGVQIIETFDPETENSEEKQRSGWQAYLDNFKKYVEGRNSAKQNL